MPQSSFQQLFDQAWQHRVAFHHHVDLDCYRLFHGYSEGLQGISIDRYSDTAIINKKADCDVAETEYIEALLAHHPFEAIVQKSHQRLKETTTNRVKYLYGAPRATPLVVHEHGRRFLADPDALHTNGLYLDVRTVRLWLAANSAERRILNLFAHTGSLGLVANMGGASEVVHLDKSKAVLGKIRENYRLNDLQPNERGLMHGDLYYHLPRAIKSGQKFSGIILDPPPKVPPPPRAPKHRPVGQDFEHLIGMCCEMLTDQGWLLCIYHNHAKDHDGHDGIIQSASAGHLKPFWQGRSDDDFPETDPNQKTRATAFIFNAR